MKEFKMRFKDFVFPSNPKKIEISTKRDIAVASLFSSKSDVQSISQKPIVVSGNGTFYGNEAEGVCTLLSHLLKQGTPGELHCPSLYPINAYFEQFTYSENAMKDGLDYSFSFIEVCSDKKESVELDYTFALMDENAFDIAKRMNVSVDKIMDLNDFPNPFNITEGERVKLK